MPQLEPDEAADIPADAAVDIDITNAINLNAGGALVDATGDGAMDGAMTDSDILRTFNTIDLDHSGALQRDEILQG